MYAVLLSKSGQKQMWKDCGFESEDEQITILFTLLLFVMEQSLKNETCTLDDVADFLDDINTRYFGKSIGRDECYALGDFLVNTVLSNQGLKMEFQGFDYEKGEYAPLYISYLANKIVYDAFDNRRTSYFLTDNGYSLLLGTLEVENNMRLTIKDLILNEHLKKQNFDKALDDIQSIFELMRIEKLKNDEAATRIRQNILSFSIDEYIRRIDDTYATINKTRKRLEEYKAVVNRHIHTFEEQHFDLDNLPSEDADKVKKLQEIRLYLDRAIDCHVDIIVSHQHYRDACTREMEHFLQCSQIERIAFSRDVMDTIFDDPSLLPAMHHLLHPLFARDLDKTFSLNKVFLPQRRRDYEPKNREPEHLDFDATAWRESQKKRVEIKKQRYTDCLLLLFECMGEAKTTSLSAVKELVESNSEARKRLFPSIGIFKEIMVDLVRLHVIDLARVRQADTLVLSVEEEAASESIQIGELLLDIVESHEELSMVRAFVTTKRQGAPDVLFEHIEEEWGNGICRSLCCTDLAFTIFE